MTLFEYKKYLQILSMGSQLSPEANWDKPNRVVPEKVTWKATQDGLHETVQD